MKSRFCIWLIVLSAMVLSCEKDPTIIDESDPSEPVLVQGKVYFTGAIPPIIDNAFRVCMTNIVSSAEDADIIVLNSSDIVANTELIKKAWNADKIIVEVEPSYQSHAKLWSSFGAPVLLSPDIEAPLLIGVRGYTSFCLQDPLALDDFLADVEVEEDESATPSEETNVEYPGTPEIEENVEFLVARMSSFMEWINDITNEKPVDSDIPIYSEFNGKLSDFITNSKYTQRVEISFPVGADNYPLCKIASSKPDRITRHSTVDVVITITPFYSYEENGKDAGDYYFVTMSVISKNGGLFQTYKKKHGAIWTYAHAFYSENINWTANISNLNNYTAGFLPNSNPSPGATQGSSSYTSSMSTTLNITGQGGAMGGKPSGTLTIGGSFSWSNSKTTQMSDMMIGLKTTDPKVEYDYLCVNFAQNDNVNKAVPLIARGDQECLSSWCWHVKGLKDGDTSTSFQFDFTLNPLYGYMYRHTSWWAEGHYRHGINLLPEGQRKYSFAITPPDRRPTGILDFMCTLSSDTLYVNNIRIKDHVKDSIYAEATSSYAKDEHLNFQLPADNLYYIEYDIRGGSPDSPKAKTYVIDSVKIQNLLTTYNTSGDGSLKK